MVESFIVSGERVSNSRKAPNRVGAVLSKTAIAGLLAFGAGGAAKAADQDVLDVHASGFKHEGGHAIAKLFLPGENVLGKGHWQAVAAIVGGQANFRFTALAKGPYAVVVFHDENDSGVIAHAPWAFRSNHSASPIASPSVWSRDCQPSKS